MEGTEDKVDSEAKRNVFTLSKFSKVITKRQRDKDTHTFAIIYAPPRSGKTTLGFDFLIPFLREKREQFAAGESKWDVPRSWKRLFKEYFAGSAEDMHNKIKNNPEESFCFIDEGNDVVSWTHQLEAEQKELVELLLKAGKKKMLIILIIPSMSLLNKVILSMAHYLFMIVNEPINGKNSALLFRNYENPILREKMPFGFKNIEKDVLQNKYLSDRGNFLNYLMKQDRFITHFVFRPIDKKLYSLYDALVKDPQIMRNRQRSKTVSASAFRYKEYALDTLLNNLHSKDGKTIAQIETLMHDKFGTQLMSRPVIKSHIDKIMMMQVKPDVKEEDAGEIVPDEDVEDLEA